MDNASNNSTFMHHFSLLLAEHAGIDDFDPKHNYIRCFAHIVNLCAQATIKAMEKADSRDVYPETDSDSESDSEGQVVRATCRAGPIRRSRKTVAFIRKSGQRRDELLNIIERGNEGELWTEFGGNEPNGRQVISLSVVTVLPDVKTRWDSVFYMLRRLRYLQQVSGTPRGSVNY